MAAPVALGMGTDIVSVARFERLVERGGDRFVGHWFTPAEIGYCRRKAFPGRHYAARFAGKEAVAKALGVGLDGPLPWRSIEIVPDDAGGAPAVRLHGTVAEAARGAGVRDVGVSLSHCDEYAVAVAWVTRA